LIGEAELIIFYLGCSESLQWGFRTAVTSGSRGRLLIIVPPVRGGDALQTRWSGFARANADWLDPDFPQLPPQDGLVALFFAKDVPVLVRGRRSRAWLGLSVRGAAVPQPAAR
jgi:hypothetical protein